VGGPARHRRRPQWAQAFHRPSPLGFGAAGSAECVARSNAIWPVVGPPPPDQRCKLAAYGDVLDGRLREAPLATIVHALTNPTVRAIAGDNVASVLVREARRRHKTTMPLFLLTCDDNSDGSTARCLSRKAAIVQGRRAHFRELLHNPRSVDVLGLDRIGSEAWQASFGLPRTTSPYHLRLSRNGTQSPERYSTLSLTSPGCGCS
jgi:hypothetical protein